MKELTWKTIQQASKMLKLVGHPVRLRIIEALEQKSQTVSNLIKRIGLPQAVISKHLKILRENGVVNSDVQKQFRVYHIAYPNVLNILNCVRQHGKK